MEVIVPTKLEDNFVLQNGSKGSSIQEAFKFNIDKIDNIYTWDKATNTFKFSFQESGTAYGDTAVSQCLVETTFTCVDQLGISLQFNSIPIVQWGLNYVGTVTVTHGNSNKYTIYIPGTRTYDPAGKTGDPHASERIGPSCSRTQAAITLGQLVAVLRGGVRSDLNELQEKLRPLINKYHGRETLFDWMFLQIKETVFLQKSVTPYPEFIKQRMTEGFPLDSDREHTREYLSSYNKGNPHLPELYYKKVAQKDPINDLFDKGDLIQFKKLAKINN